MSGTKCVYCNSSAFGPGCPFSDHRKHFHAGDPKICVWCGSRAFGPGCPFNPFGTTHVHGVQYNQMVSDSVESGVIGGYILEKLTMPVTDMKAYKLGLVDKTGKRIRTPETYEERQALGIVEEYVLNLKQALGNKLDTFKSLSLMKLEEQVSMDDFEKLCNEKLKLKDKFENAITQLKNVLNEAYGNGLSSAAIEKIIVETMLKQ